MNKIKRANYVTRMITNAMKNDLVWNDPSKHGWRKVEGKSEYEVSFFHGAQYPEILCSEYVNRPEETDNFDFETASISDSEDDEYEP